MQLLLQAVYEYWIECVLLIGVMFIGVNLGKFLRMKKDAKKNKE